MINSFCDQKYCRNNTRPHIHKIDVLRYVIDNPGTTAKQIALALNCSTKQVNRQIRRISEKIVIKYVFVNCKITKIFYDGDSNDR